MFDRYQLTCIFNLTFNGFWHTIVCNVCLLLENRVWLLFKHFRKLKNSCIIDKLQYSRRYCLTQYECTSFVHACMYLRYTKNIPYVCMIVVSVYLCMSVSIYVFVCIHVSCLSLSVCLYILMYVHVIVSVCMIHVIVCLYVCLSVCAQYCAWV